MGQELDSRAAQILRMNSRERIAAMAGAHRPQRIFQEDRFRGAAHQLTDDVHIEQVYPGRPRRLRSHTSEILAEPPVVMNGGPGEPLVEEEHEVGEVRAPMRTGQFDQLLPPVEDERNQLGRDIHGCLMRIQECTEVVA